MVLKGTEIFHINIYICWVLHVKFPFKGKLLANYKLHKLPGPLCQLRQNPINIRHVLAFNVLVPEGIILYALQINIAIAVPDTLDITLRNAGITVETRDLQADHNMELLGV